MGLKVYYRVYRNLKFDPKLGEMSPHPHTLFNTNFNIIFPFTSGSRTTRIQFTLFGLSELLTRLSSLREGCGYIVCQRAHFFLKTEAVRSTETSVNFYKNEIKLNAISMQLGNFIDVFLARHVSGTYAHHQEQ